MRVSERTEAVSQLPDNNAHYRKCFAGDLYLTGDLARCNADGYFFTSEVVPITLTQKKGNPLVFDKVEHPRETSLESLAKLKGVVKEDGTVTAGNASSVNDGACALLLASDSAIKRHGRVPKARVLAMATTGVAPRIMGFGPAPAMRKVLEKTGLNLAQMDIIELNEAFAAQGLAVTRDHGLPDDAAHVNPNGGARLITMPMYQSQRVQGRYALCTMGIGVGAGDYPDYRADIA